MAVKSVLKRFYFVFVISIMGMGMVLFSQKVETPQGWSVSGVLDGLETPTGSFIDISAIDLDSEGNLFILDSGRNRLLKYSVKGRLIKEIGGFGSFQDLFNEPRDLDAHLTLNIFVTDYNNHRVVLFDNHLNYLNEFKSVTDDLFYFEMPLSVAVNNQYDLFILEDLNKRIVKYDRFNQPKAQFGMATDNLGQLFGPHQVAMGSKNEIFISDPLSKSIQVFDFLGNFLREIVHPDFIEPLGIDVSPRDFLLVADQKGQKVYFFTTKGTLVEELDLKSFEIVPTDVALWRPGGTETTHLYVSSATKCYRLIKSGS
jgi:hypothetical protein